MNYIKEYRISLHLLETQEGREFAELVSDLLDTPEVKSLADLRHHMRVNRIQHVLSVAYLSYAWAKRRGLNAVETARAALLHDLYYYDYTKRELYPKGHNFVHAKTALENAMRITYLSELQKDIILSHMWPVNRRRPNSREGLAVCKMDKICSVFEFFYSCFSGKKSVKNYRGPCRIQEQDPVMKER